jgi:tripartite-type tricarboxylate transporter receptor subunit TctC
MEWLPQVPTVAESGYKVYEADLWYGLFCAGEGAERNVIA